MNIEAKAATMADRNGGALPGGLIAAAVVAILLLAPAVAPAAEPGGSGSGGKSHAVTLESIAGSTAKRITLSAKAAERLGIETGKVDEQPIVRKQMVGGLVISPVEIQPEAKPPSSQFGGFKKVGAAPVPKPVSTPPVSSTPGEAWVLVTLSEAEWDRLAKGTPAQILPLATRDAFGKELLAMPSGMPPVEDVKRSMLSVYYVVPGSDHGLELNRRVRVQLQVSGGDEKRKVVPYGAVYYDATGNAWAYVNPEPLVFERQRIEVERIVGDLAVLSSGPPVGTPVVTVGAAMLYGAEIFGK